MSIDLSKLSPAPWTFGYEDDGPHCLIGSQAMFWCRVVNSPERSAVTDAAFIALARNAFAGDPAALAWWEANRKQEMSEVLGCGCVVTKGWRCPMHNQP